MAGGDGQSVKIYCGWRRWSKCKNLLWLEEMDKVYKCTAAGYPDLQHIIDNGMKETSQSDYL
jgi:hypothetical protein